MKQVKHKNLLIFVLVFSSYVILVYVISKLIRRINLRITWGWWSSDTEVEQEHLGGQEWELWERLKEFGQRPRQSHQLDSEELDANYPWTAAQLIEECKFSEQDVRNQEAWKFI